MPTQTEELVNELRAIKARLDYLEGWEAALQSGRPRFIEPVWELGQATTIGTTAVMQLIDGAAADVYFVFRPPLGLVAFEGLWLVWTSAAVAGDMYWEIDVQWGEVGELYNQNTESLAAAVTATGGANIINVQEHPGSLVLANLSEGDYLGIRVNRRADLAPDTLGAVVYVLGMVFTYRGWE